MKLIEIADGFSLIPCAGMVVKRGNEGQSVVFTPGQSALEGFVVDREYDEVCEEIDEALEEQYGEKD